MAKKILKNRTQFTSTLENGLYEALRELSRESGVPITRLLDRAVEGLLEGAEKEKK